MCTFLCSRNCFRNRHITVPHLIGGDDGDIVLVQRVYCYQSGRGGRADVLLYVATVCAQRKSTHVDSVLCDGRIVVYWSQPGEAAYQQADSDVHHILDVHHGRPVWEGGREGGREVGR